MSRHYRVGTSSTPPPAYEDVLSNPNQYHVRRPDDQILAVSPQVSTLYDYQPRASVIEAPVPVEANEVTTRSASLTDDDDYGSDDDAVSLSNQFSLGAGNQLQEQSNNSSKKKPIPTVSGASYEQSNRNNTQLSRDAEAGTDSSSTSAVAAAEGQPTVVLTSDQNIVPSQTGDEQSDALTLRAIDRAKQVPLLQTLCGYLSIQTLSILILTSIFTLVDDIKMTVIGPGFSGGMMLAIVLTVFPHVRKTTEQGAQRDDKLRPLMFLAMLLPVPFLSTLFGYFDLEGMIGVYVTLEICFLIAEETFRTKPELFTKSNKLLGSIIFILFLPIPVTVGVIFSIVQTDDVQYFRDITLEHIPDDNATMEYYALVYNSSELANFRVQHNAELREMVDSFTDDEIDAFMKHQLFLKVLLPVAVCPTFVILLFMLIHRIKYEEFQNDLHCYVIESLISITLIPLTKPWRLIEIHPVQH